MRRMADTKLQPITIYFPREFVATLDEQVERLAGERSLSQTSRSDLERELVEIGLREKSRKR